MGQRLNIEIYNKGKLLANCYYHWSAYTKSSLELTKQIVDFIQKASKYPIKDKLLLAIHALQCTGAGVHDSDLVYLVVDKGYNIDYFTRAVDRNEGLISVTKDEMMKTRFWEEGRVSIYLDKEKINFDVFLCLDDEDIEQIEEGEYDISSLDWDKTNISFEDFNEFAKDILSSSCYIKFINNEDYIYGMIE